MNPVESWAEEVMRVLQNRDSDLVDFLSLSLSLFLSLVKVNYDSILKEILIGLGERDESRISGDFEKLTYRNFSGT